MMNKVPTDKNKIKLLIVSVGSLVGQNILDALEYPEFYRRHHFSISGTNSLSYSANNFRCDECFLVPPTASDVYPERMKEIIHKTEPDLILTARDADTIAIKKLKIEDDSLPGEICYGSIQSIEYALHKWKSFQFCEKHNLPFASSWFREPGKDFESLLTFIESVSYPLIVKPVEGFASKGVYFVRNRDEAQYFFKQKESLFQEYLGKSEVIESYLKYLDGPKPLFTQVPAVSHHTCHIPISPDGTIGEVFVLKNHHNFGAVTQLQRVRHPELEELALRFAKAFVKEGGCGPLSVQFRPDKRGIQKAQEMNLRTTGSTLPRLIMGQDEIGYIVRGCLPELNFPLYTRAPDQGYSTIVTKSLNSYKMSKKDIDSLEQSNYWGSE